MTGKNLDYIIGVLKGGDPLPPTDWYDVLGFLYCHKIAGLFYNRAAKGALSLPWKITKLLSDAYEAQARRVRFMRAEIRDISGALIASGAEHVFLKGSVLANIAEKECAVYEDGERISNDIDILVKPDKITAVSDVLKTLGYQQGTYDKTTDRVAEFSRLEILKRRMSRGETAPFLKATGNPEVPFIEVDINFSLGNVPGERETLLAEMLATRKKYEGKAPMYIANEEMFFLQLVLHQYKESCLYFTVERGKDLDLYKLADMYYLWKGELFDKSRLKRLVCKYGAQKETGAVLGQTGRIFSDGEILSAAEEYGDRPPEVTDYDRKKKYRWTADERTRLGRFDAKSFLREIKDNDQ